VPEQDRPLETFVTLVPVRCHVREATLMEYETNRYRVREILPLGG
jgi:hypothetical protein